MGGAKGLGPVKRFGVRYGRTVKHKRGNIEREQKKPQICPYCKRPKAKRLSAGIYNCQKCNSKFTGKAYFLAPIVKKQGVEEMPIEEATEEEA